MLRDTVVTLNEQLVARFGGPPGIRDSGLLESALSRPQNQFAYGNATLFDLAAGHAFGIVMDHPFVDGNKRTGFIVAALFIELNGYSFSASEADTVVRTLALAAGESSEADYAAWLKANSKRRRTIRNAALRWDPSARRGWRAGAS